jgi:hypothetical protein
MCLYQAKAAEAKKICEDSGKQLVSLDAEEKHESICEHLKTTSKIFLQSFMPCEVNLQIGQAAIPHLTSLKMDATGKHTWTPGSNSFIRWCPQQPAKGNGDCAAIVDSCMKVADCEQATQFLCEESEYSNRE